MAFQAPVLLVKKIKSEWRSIAFNRLRGLFFKILNYLNPDFMLNMGLSHSKAKSRRNVAPETSAQNPVNVVEVRAAAASSQSGVSVLNDNKAIASKGLIEDLLVCIFEDSETIDAVIAVCGSKIFGGLSIHQIEGILEDSLKAQIQSEPTNPNLKRALEMMGAHRLRTRANSLAYTTEGKIRPSALIWPDPTDPKNGRSLFDELPYVKQYPLIDKSTPIVSAGSCFATEIARHLQKHQYNYVVTEPNADPKGNYWLAASDNDHVARSSAAWGIIFNSPSFRQLVEKAFNERELPKILWTQQVEGKLRYLDPFREDVIFPSAEAYEANYEIHRQAAREAFLKAKLLVVTPGVNEVWYFKADGSVFSRSPWRTAPSLVEHKVLTPEENVRDLQRMLDILRVHNPELKLVVTLSPIPLHATFCADYSHVIAANAHSKAVLRVALEEFVRRNRDVYYFPSYEVISHCLQAPWSPDQRHVTHEAVATVMKLFGHMFYTSP